MQLIRGLHNLSLVGDALNQGCVVTIGNFDGVHLGHQAVLHQVHDYSQNLRLPSVVMIFEPLPVEFFRPDQAPVRLMNLREKLRAFLQTEADFVLLCRFDQTFAQQPAEQFIQDVLVDKLQVKQLVVGDDFRFGYQRLGDFALLKQVGRTVGFSVTDMRTYQTDAERVSSTRIRRLLAQNDLSLASDLLGEPFNFNGRVIHGQKLGRKIGFRTLNLNPKREKMPVLGVFAVTVAGIAERDWEGVANIGVRPTVNGLRPSIEVHLFNWSEELYGRHVTVKLQHFIRPEMKFENLEALVAQIEQDAARAKTFFNLTENVT